MCLSSSVPIKGVPFTMTEGVPSSGVSALIKLLGEMGSQPKNDK